MASICRERSDATTRQVPNSAESSKAWPPPSLAIALAAAAGIPGDGKIEIGHLAAERRVADGAADDPRLAAALQSAPGQVDRRRRREAIREAHAVARDTRAEIPQVIS